MTTVTTQNPVRSDLASTEAGGADRTTTPSRLWAVAGIGAALAGAGTIVTSSAVDIVYRDEFSHVQGRRCTDERVPDDPRPAWHASLIQPARAL